VRLAISNFRTRCRVPRRSRLTQDVVERVIRRGFAAECVRRLNSLPDSGAVIRIRRLPLELKIKSADLSEEELARLWAIEFFRALTNVVASPQNQNGAVVTSESRAAWLARFISDLASGSAQSRWEYEEFADVLKLGTVDAVLTVLRREPAETVSVLQLLQRERKLDRLLSLFDDFAYEQLFSISSIAHSSKTLELTIEDLFTVGELAQFELPAGGILATRRRALLIFLQLANAEHASAGPAWSARLVLYALITLDTLVDAMQSLASELWASELVPELLARSRRALNPTTLALLEQVRRLATEPDATTREQKLAPLFHLLHNLAPDVAVKTEMQKQSYWVSGDCMGFLLLAGLIDRFRWPQRILETELGRNWGQRAVVCFLAGLAQHLLGKDPESRDLDPGVALFAGWIKPASADVSLLRTMFSSTSNEERLDLIHALDVSGSSEQSVASTAWEKTFAHLGDYLLREFASRVRGFRKATPAFVVNTFLKQGGRACIDDKRILVILQPNAFHVALHLSSVDEPVESVSWLDNLRLEFQLEGL